jgi:endonuclease G
MIKLIIFFLLSFTQLIAQLEIPKDVNNCQYIIHSHFSLCYDESHEQARWVAYELTKYELISKFKRKNNFKPDPKVTTGSAIDKNYIGSGYHRGHLVPAADLSFNEMALNESFYFSNISPQLPAFNGSGGLWYNLEMAQREWARNEESIFIVAGPILSNDLPKLPNSKVSIPKAFYKAILDYSNPSFKAIAFVLPHQASKESFFKYAVSIDSLENLLGFDLFSELPDSLEAVLEQNFNIDDWNISNKKVSNMKLENSNEKYEFSSVQCKGITKKGTRCLRMTTSGKYCWQHE